MPWEMSGSRVAVLGYGHQGEAQAQNLRRSGIPVVVGARPQGAAADRARADGFTVMPLPQAAASADIAACLLPDEVFPEVFAGELRGAIRARATLVFAHGFNLLYHPPPLDPAWDVFLVSPAGPGSALREAYGRGGVPAYLAVHQDPSGAAWEKAAAYAAALGCSRTLRTTVREETEVDLFGEQAVLCGGMHALVTAAFETLVEAGYSPELAYVECVDQLAYLAQALQEKGVAGLRRSISGTALYGDVTRGPRVLGPEGKQRLRAILDEIRSGAFAEEWFRVAAGAAPLATAHERSAAHPLERARERVRHLTEAGDGPPQNRATPCPKSD